MRNKCTLLFFVLSISVSALQAQVTFSGKKIISKQVVSPSVADLADFDTDGDPDIFSSSFNDDKLALYFNDEKGHFGYQSLISISVNYPICSHISDFNTDGTPDIISIEYQNSSLTSLYGLTNDGNANFSTPQTLIDSLHNPVSAFSRDMDGDHDSDLVIYSMGLIFNYYQDNNLSWYENIDGNGTYAHKTIISDSSSHSQAYCIPADFDGDYDPDILTLRYHDSLLLWYENLDSTNHFGAGQVIDTSLKSASYIHIFDPDGDGDRDILYSSWNSSKILGWFENTDGAGTFSNFHPIANNLISASTSASGDLDNDGDQDVVVSSPQDNLLLWFENLDGLGNFGPAQTLSSKVDGISSINIQDMDDDTDLDILVSDHHQNEIFWLESYLIFQAPVADFQVSDSIITPGDSVKFTNLVQGPVNSYHWDFGNGQTSSLPNPTHAYDSTGIYTVSLAVSNSAGQDTMIKTNCIDVSVNIHEKTRNPFRIYPNPASNKFFIENPEQHSGRYILTDLNGKILRSGHIDKQKRASIDISNYAQGIYFVKIITAERNYYHKLLIKAC